MNVPSAIIGGIALNANGIARFTEDIDATIPGAGLDLDRLVKQLAKNRIVPRAANAVEFARQNQVLLLRHTPSGIELDVSLAWITFELDAIDRAIDLDFDSVRIRAARPEDLLIYKIIANRPQDLWDAERLLLLFPESIDRDRVRQVLGEISEQLEGPDRLAVLRRLVGSLPSARRGGRGPRAVRAEVRAEVRSRKKPRSR